MIRRPLPEVPAVVADANVLFANDARNVFVTLAYEGLIALRGSDEIEAEWVRNLVARYADLTAEKVERTAGLLREAVPDYAVAGYRAFLDRTGKTDPKDRHVAAAALACAPSHLVTWNLADFDADALGRADVAVDPPDAFLCALFDGRPHLIFGAARSAYTYVRRVAGHPTWPEYLDRLAARGAPDCLAAFAERLRRWGPDGDAGPLAGR